MSEERLSEERIDNMGFDNLRLIQRPEDFCYGIDAVTLADFASRGMTKDARCLADIRIADLGAGNGAVSMILSYKFPRSRILAVEVQREAANLAKRNAILNDVEERMEVFCGDILNLPDKWRDTMDMVVCNPPYVQRNSGINNKHSSKDIARRESTAGLADFLRVARVLLKEKGDLYMVHRPSRLVELLSEGRCISMEPKTLLPVAPKEGRPANLILIHFVKNGGHQLTLMPELRVYREDGSYTEEIEAIYERR